MFALNTLWRAPLVNPVNKKARSIPALNPFDMYGRVFFFSWFGFMIAFWSWYAFPPLLSDVIAKDLKLKQYQIANSNIISLVAT
jgi:NNP family nitrate/nitrite transporter-like MFS transporter